MIRVSGKRMVMVEQSLLRGAIRIIETERSIAFESYRIPGTDEIPNADQRAEVRRYDTWLKKARAVLA